MTVGPWTLGIVLSLWPFLLSTQVWEARAPQPEQPRTATGWKAATYALVGRYFCFENPGSLHGGLG